MHTNLNHRFGRGYLDSEARLVALKTNHEARGEREEQLEQRVKRGRSIHSVADADAAIKSDAVRCVESLGKQKVTWLNWLNHFCSTELAMKANMRDRAKAYADRMIKQSGLYVGVIAGNVFQRGKRSLMMLRHAQFEKEFVADMQSYYGEQERVLQQDEALYGGLSAALAKQQVAVKIGSSAQRQKILAAIGTLQAELDGNVQKQEAANQDALELFRQQAADANHLKGMLLKLGVIDSSTRLNDLLERAGRDGDTALYTLIKTHPNLNGADKVELRKTLLQTVEDLRRHGRWWNFGLIKGTSGWYQEFLQGRSQPINGEALFKVLQDEQFDRRIHLEKLPGLPAMDVEVEKKNRDGTYTVFDPRSRAPMILDPNSHELTYMTGGTKGKVKHVSLDDYPECIALAA